MNDSSPTSDNAPRSFTRFVLPFSWKVRRADASSSDAGAPFFRQMEGLPPSSGLTWPNEWLTIPARPKPNEHWYFHRAVHELIYERATWFVLSGRDGVEPGTKVTPRSHPTKVPGTGSFLIRPAGLVLFDTDSIPNDLDSVRQGLLVMQTEDDLADPPTFERHLYWNEHFRTFQSCAPSEGQKGAELANVAIEDLPERWLAQLRHPVKLGSNHFHVVDAKTEKGHAGTFPHADGRAFVWSALFHHHPQWTGLARQCSAESSAIPEGLGAWIKALNVDSASDNSGDGQWDTEASSPFEREWAASLTYRRWAHYGTLFGFTPHSGVLFSENGTLVAKSFRETYFAMVVYLLFVRQQMASFSHQLSVHAGALASGGAPDEEVRRAFATLRQDFLIFTNRCWFPQISNQQQAQEMYPLAKEALGIEAVYTELRRAIEGTEAWLAERSRDEQEAAAHRLNVLAGCGVVVALTISVWDLTGGWHGLDNDPWYRTAVVSTAFVVFSCLTAGLMWKPLCAKVKSWRDGLSR